MNNTEKFDLLKMQLDKYKYGIELATKRGVQYINVNHMHAIPPDIAEFSNKNPKIKYFELIAKRYFPNMVPTSIKSYISTYRIE